MAPPPSSLLPSSLFTPPAANHRRERGWIPDLPDHRDHYMSFKSIDTPKESREGTPTTPPQEGETKENRNRLFTGSTGTSRAGDHVGRPVVSKWFHYTTLSLNSCPGSHRLCNGQLGGTETLDTIRPPCSVDKDMLRHVKTNHVSGEFADM